LPLRLPVIFMVGSGCSSFERVERLQTHGVASFAARVGMKLRSSRAANPSKRLRGDGA
jgi:hypothetical protein